MLLKNKTNNNGYCTPLAHFPELEGKFEPIFLAISGKLTEEEQKQLDSLKNYKKLETIPNTKYVDFEYKGVHIQVIKVNLSNAEFTWHSDRLHYILDQWTWDIDILCNGISYNIYDATYSNRDGMMLVIDEDIKEVVIEEIENADDLFTFNNKEVSK